MQVKTSHIAAVMMVTDDADDCGVDDKNVRCVYCRCRHFESLGSPLRSIHVYPTVASQVSRYVDQVVTFDA